MQDHNYYNDQGADVRKIGRTLEDDSVADIDVPRIAIREDSWRTCDIRRRTNERA
jgi:hypothetical protein